MKKFTFMLLTAFIAVAALASGPKQAPIKGQANVSVASLKMASGKQVVPTKLAVSKVTAPAQKSSLMRSVSKTSVRKAESQIDLVTLLSQPLMLVSDYYEYDEQTGGLVAANPGAGGWEISLENVDPTQVVTDLTTTGSTTVLVSGFTSEATEAIEANLSLKVSDELAAEGVIAVLTIPSGQALFTSSYGTVGIENASSDGDITAYVTKDGGVMFEDLWYDVLLDGDYEGYMWSGICYLSAILPVNGTMTWSNGTDEKKASLLILQSADNPKYVTVFNFGDEQTAIVVTMKEGNTFAIESQLMFDAGSTYGQFYTYATDGSSVSSTITGTGTNDALTFDTGWTFYAPTTGYWYGLLNPATITLTQGEFVYPVIEDVAAVPATPEPLKIGDYDAEKGYGYFAFTVPTTDVDGNELKESNLYYQLFSDIAGDIQPITFTPDLYEKLTEDMSVIPYTFTDNWDFADYTTYKIVFLNYNFNTMYDRIGVKSIYTGGGETNESEIAWMDIEKPEPQGPVEVTYNFNSMDVPTSNNASHDGDITELVDFIEGDVTMTISPNDPEVSSTPNRFWSTTAGPQLRMYSGTLTFSVPEGKTITQIVFNHNGKWGEGNAATPGVLTNDADNKVATWTGEAQEVVIAIAANSQINSIVVTIAAGGDEPDPDVAIDPDGKTYTFEDGTLGGWTNIDADGDGYVWAITTEGLSAHNGSSYAVYSKSYDNEAGALTPDNYLVSPKVKLGSTFSFFAVAQDGSYPSEHFGVFVSTTGKKASDFEMVEEWTLTKVRLNKRGNAPRKVQGKWYQYIVDLSKYEGQEGYVAIRHFDCTDMFYMLVDDITFGTPADPDPEPEPEELVVLPEGVEPIEYTLNAAGATSQSSISIEETMNVAFDGTDVYLQGLAYYFPESYVKGTLSADGQVLVPTGQFVGEDESGVEYIVALGADEEGNFTDEDYIIFDYDAESGVISLADGIYYGESGSKTSDALWDYFDEATYTPGALVLPDVVEAPEGLETETWYLTCDSYNGKIRAREVQLGSDGLDMYIQGLCEYLPEAWVKGTIDNENNTVTFESGQFYGTYQDQYRLFFVGYDSDTQEIADVVFSLDAENQTMTTDHWIILNGKQNNISYYDYYLDIVISKEMPEVPEVVVAPEDLATEPYYFKGYDTYYEEDVTSEVQVGFYGENEVYFQGLSNYITDAWVKGTIENGVVTIPETYLGLYESLFGDTEVFFSGATFAYDAEAGTFTSPDGYVTYEDPDDEYMMDEFINVVLTKLTDVAATPADPVINSVTITDTNYPNIKFTIPTEDVAGAPIIAGKLAYQLFIEKDGEVTPLVLDADLYDELDEDMSEIPYGFTDGWDIYTSTVYLNQGEEEIATWKKIGIQSIYYGGGECNKSNIVWEDLTGTGIASLLQDASESTIYNLAGQRVQKAQKGVFIVNGKKVAVK